MANPLTFDPLVQNRLLGFTPAPVNPLINFQDQLRQATQPWMRQTPLVPPPNQTPVQPPAQPTMADADRIAGPSAVISAIGEQYPEPNPVADLAAAIPKDVETTTTQKKQDKAEKAAETALVKDFDQQKANALAKTDVDVSKANALDAQSQKDLEFSQELDRKRAEREAYANRKLEEADAYLSAKRKDYEENGSIKDIFGGDAGKRLNAVLLSGIGSFAAAHGSGRMGNLVGERIDAEMKQWHDQEMSRIKQSEELLKMAREDREHALATADLELKNREVSGLDVLAKERAKILSSFGAQDAAIAGDKGILEIEQKKQEKLQQIHEGLRATVANKVSNQTQQEMAKAVGAAALKKANPEKQSQETVAAVGMINEGINAADEIKDIIKRNPQALAEYQAAHHKWLNTQKIEAGGGPGKWAMTGARLLGGLVGKDIPTSEEQLMPSVDAQRIHRLNMALTTGIAKGYGGTITEGDRQTAGSTIASLATGNPDLVAESYGSIGKTLKDKRDLYIKNTGAQIPKTASEMKSGKATPEEQAKGVRILEQMEKEGKRGTPEYKRLVNALQAALKEGQGG